MNERDYYPMGAYDDPNAPYNQVEPDLIPADYEVTMYVTLNTSVTADTSYKVYDEDGVSIEYLDDHIDIAREEVKVPDLKWHKFGEELPKTGVPILVRAIIGGRKTYFVNTINGAFEQHLLCSKDGEWQYINEESYELSVEETDIELV